MLELNRLQQMPENYDEKLFNHLYSKTENLRRKLTSEIDPRRFGLSYEDILSFFDIKFIFVFSKYYQESEGILLGYLINAMKNFKCRILRKAYTKEFSQSIVSVDDVLTLEENLYEHQVEVSNKEYYHTLLMDFMKKHLSMNAYTIMDLQLNPSPYIQHKLNISPDANIQKIPDHLLLEYLELGNSAKAYKYLDSLKKEIRNAIGYAKIALNTKCITVQ